MPKWFAERAPWLADQTNEDASPAAAMARMSAMVGALILARAVDDPELSNAIMGATRASLETPAPRAPPKRARKNQDARP